MAKQGERMGVTDLQLSCHPFIFQCPAKKYKKFIPRNKYKHQNKNITQENSQ